MLRNRNTLRRLARYGENYHLACAATITGEPQFYKKAMSSKDANKWQLAMEEEIASLKKNETWNLEQLPPNRRAIDCKWIYKIKRKHDGSIN